jgi:hypothetical protein
MKTKEELRKHYDCELLPCLKELESRRKATLAKIAAFTVLMICLVLAVIAAAAGIFVFARQCSVTFCCLPAFPILWIAAYFIGFSKIAAPYRRQFKSEIMPKIVKYVSEGLEYDFKGHIPVEEFRKSEIFTVEPDIYTGEDRVYGRLGETGIDFSEIVAQEKRRDHDTEGSRSTSYVTIFRGIFLVADFNKRFKSKTLVLPDTAEKLFGKMVGGFIQSKNIMRPPLVKLEDPEFEKHFVVYSKDQIEARYILSPALMKRITEYRMKTGKNIFLSFVDNKLRVAIPYKKNLFEPRLFRSIVDFEKMEEFHSIIQLTADIVEDLNLNTRIWKK